MLIYVFRFEITLSEMKTRYFSTVLESSSLVTTATSLRRLCAASETTKMAFFLCFQRAEAVFEAGPNDNNILYTHTFIVYSLFNGAFHVLELSVLII